ncbi:hypothetical protein PAAG_11907 [Paracoccidioides lutzii Pb01]|uniref:Uncharacterized protein n=1 Tax=Paracoccidioides lutzii (strain ATCC MYA-826 / Pb01) TaxID=502779 RepID=A0A0A2V5L6_PARBA|nr:hypothetical protein PAAG_11907 [Paracoccidioides lutzii Pb01]KGQ01440.1 hypothetical protein PAAG_11907 [Paracoccidioides lutzii Pb01]
MPWLGITSAEGMGFVSDETPRHCFPATQRADVVVDLPQDETQSNPAAGEELRSRRSRDACHTGTPDLKSNPPKVPHATYLQPLIASGCLFTTVPISRLSTIFCRTVERFFWLFS